MYSFFVRFSKMERGYWGKKVREVVFFLEDFIGRERGFGIVRWFLKIVWYFFL